MVPNKVHDADVPFEKEGGSTRTLNADRLFHAQRTYASSDPCPPATASGKTCGQSLQDAWPLVTRREEPAGLDQTSLLGRRIQGIYLLYCGTCPCLDLIVTTTLTTRPSIHPLTVHTTVTLHQTSTIPQHNSQDPARAFPVLDGRQWTCYDGKHPG